VGKVKHSGSEIGDIGGKWSNKMNFTPSGAAEKRVLFDAQRGADIAPMTVAPESEQEPNESRRLWQGLTKAIADRNMDAATEAKSSVEESQREQRKKREESGQKYVPRFFELRDGRWLPKITVPQDPKEAVTAVQSWIWAQPQ